MDVLAHLGINPEVLPSQYETKAVRGRTLITDGDGPAYVIASKVKRLDTAIRQYQTEMLTQMYLAGAEDIECHLTSSRCDKFGRSRIMAVQPYQGNRKNKDKPPLLEPLREAMTLPENWLPELKVELHKDIEADDAMIISAHRLGENGVIRSDDKDLRCTPWYYHEIKDGEVRAPEPVGYIAEAFTPSGARKMVGQGPMFFWLQMLMGDTADHVKGLQRLDGKLCGMVAAFNALREMKTVSEAANFVVDAYREIEQNVIAEGWMMHLLRHPHDNFWVYAHECGLSQINQEFMQWCAKQRWRLKPHERRDQKDGKWVGPIYEV